MSSDWRLEKSSPDYKYLVQKLYFKGHIELYGHTPDIKWDKRGTEIRTWLAEYDVENYVILDDNLFDDFNGELLEHFIEVDPDVGLTDTNVKQAIDILLGKII